MTSQLTSGARGSLAAAGGVIAPGRASSTRTVERALTLLSEVCSREAVTLTECARHTGLPASTALRLGAFEEDLSLLTPRLPSRRGPADFGPQVL